MAHARARVDVVGAERRAHELPDLCTRFVAGCEREGVAREEALHVWDLIANFASFAFCKAHAVTYGRISYRTVWLKTHPPAEFLAAFLQSDTGYYDPRVLRAISGGRNHAIAVTFIEWSGAADQNVIVDWTSSTPSSSLTNSSICSETCGPIGQPGLVSVNVTCTTLSSTSTA